MTDDTNLPGNASEGRTTDTVQSSDRGRIPRPGWPTAIGGVLLAALVAVTFSPVRRAGFIMDDDINIALNRTLYSPFGLVQMWLMPSTVDQYYPLMHTTFWIESRLWGFDPLGYHVVNVLLHLANVFLLWRLLDRLQVPGAWLAAAVFAVHPVVVESVAWAVERKNLLSMCLSLGSMLCYFRFSPSAAEARRNLASAERWYWASGALFALAMFSKTAVITLPAVLLVIRWWKVGRITWSDVEPLVPFIVFGVALSMVTVYQERTHCGARGADFDWTFAERFLMAGQALWFYAEKLVWPDPIMFFYPGFSSGALQFCYPVAALAVPVALWLMRGRWGRGPLAGVLIFAGVLMPALGFFNVYYFLFAPVADHFQYHACPAFIALLTAGAVTAWGRVIAWVGTLSREAGGVSKVLTVLGWVVAAALLLLLAERSYAACQVVESEEKIYRDVIAKNPASWIAYTQLGVQLAIRNEFDDALAAGRKALELAPQRARVHHNYASTIFARIEHEDRASNELDEAIAHFQRAIEINPELAAHYAGLGLALARAERYSEAVAALQRAVEIEPQNDDAQRHLASVQQKDDAAAAQQPLPQSAAQKAPER